MVPAHPSGEKIDIFLADRPRIKDLDIIPMFKRFDKQFKNRAAVADRKGLSI
jgi:hypothetical protein